MREHAIKHVRRGAVALALIEALNTVTTTVQFNTAYDIPLELSRARG